MYRLLALDNIRVVPATTGSAGLATALLLTFDALVVDLCLPDMHGLTFLSILRGRVSVPALVVTGCYINQWTECHATAAGAAAVRFKPLFADDVAALIRHIVMNRECTDSQYEAVRPLDTTGERGIPAIFNDLPDISSTNRCQTPIVDRDQYLRELFRLLVNPCLPLMSFDRYARLLRTILTHPPDTSLPALTQLVCESASSTPVDSSLNDLRVQHILAILDSAPRWYDEAQLADRIRVSRSRLAHLIRDTLGLDFVTLRRQAVMKAGIRHVLRTPEHIGQIAYGLGMHPSTFQNLFTATFGTNPRSLRRYYQHLLRPVPPADYI